MASEQATPGASDFTLAGLWRGARAATPLSLGTVPFGLGFGVLADQKGLSLLDTLAMSALVWSGTAQMAVMELWGAPLPYLAILLTTLAVGTRMLLMSASLRPWLGGLAPLRAYGALAFVSNGNWALAIRRFRAGERDAAFLVGGGLAMYAGWLLGSAAGHLGGALVAEPRHLGLDFVFTAFMLAMVGGVWRGRGDILPWVAAGLVAVLTAAFVPGYAYIFAGAGVGSILGALRETNE